MIKQFVARTLFHPLYSRFYRKDNRVAQFRFYRKAQWRSMQTNQRYQADLLYEVIDHACTHVPYYQKLVKKNGITYSRSTILADVKKFPVLTKDVIRKEFKDLYVPQKNVPYYVNTSGGSTGEPVRFVQDSSYDSRSSAMVRLQHEWAGYHIGECQVKLWGSEKDILKETEALRHRFARWVRNVHLLNSFLMDDEKMRQFVAFINRKKPVMILAYAQSINELATYIEKHSLIVHSPHAIMTSAGVLYPDFRARIERVFRCPVFNSYGSREAGSIACECDRHVGLHVSSFTHFVEILNDKLQPCREGEIGNIYVTSLTNITMPLIRYRIGDMARYTARLCSCGRGLPLIRDVVGRDVDLFINAKGQKIDGEYFTHLFYFKHYIKKFQVIQEAVDRVMVKVVVNSPEDKKDIDREFPEIARKMKLVMGEGCTISYQVVPEIKPTTSGKYRYTIRRF